MVWHRSLAFFALVLLFEAVCLRMPESDESEQDRQQQVPIIEQILLWGGTVKYSLPNSGNIVSAGGWRPENLRELKPGQATEVARSVVRNGSVIGIFTNQFGPSFFKGVDLDDEFLSKIGVFRNLKSFYVTCPKVTNAGLDHLISLSRLREISLDGARVDNEGVAKLSQISLNHLSLRWSLVTDPGCSELSKLMKLESLDLNGTDVSDAGVVHLLQMKNLKWLGLSETYVTDDGVHKFWDLLPKCEVSATSRKPSWQVHRAAALRRLDITALMNEYRSVVPANRQRPHLLNREEMRNEMMRAILSQEFYNRPLNLRRSHRPT